MERTRVKTAGGKSWRTAVFALVGLIAVVGAPGSARAAEEEEGPKKVIDARLEGLANAKGEIQDLSKDFSDGYALTWFLFVGLAVVASASLFKDPRRSHLD